MTAFWFTAGLIVAFAAALGWALCRAAALADEVCDAVSPLTDEELAVIDAAMSEPIDGVFVPPVRR